MRFPQAQAAQILDFLAENGVEEVNFSVLEPLKSGDGNCMKCGGRPRRRAEVEKSLAWASARNQAGANVYFRPARHRENGAPASWPVIFLDDLSAGLAAGVAKKYRSAVIETSDGNFQVWIITSKVLAEGERHQVQSALARLVGTDLGSVSGEHFGRFPGYRNQKPGRGGFWIHVEGINHVGQVLDPSSYLDHAPALCQPSPWGGRVPSQSSLQPRDDGDESALEFRFAIARLIAGDAPAAIEKRIAAHAMARGKRTSAPACAAYARTTVSRAQHCL